MKEKHRKPAGQGNRPPIDVAPKELDAASLQQYSPQERLKKLVDMVIQAARLKGPAYEDAASVILAVKEYAHLREIKVEEEEDVRIILAAIAAQKKVKTSSDPNAMEAVKNIYLRLRSQAFPPEK